MTTLTTLLGRLRTDLQDPAAAIWTDSELTGHLDRAVRELSARIPRERRSAVTTTAGSRTIDVSGLADPIGIVAIEWPVGLFPKVYQPFSYYAATLELTGAEVPDGTGATVYWLGLHTLDNATSTIPVHLEDLILLGAGAHALLDQAAQTINAVNTGGTTTGVAYRTLGETRLAQFAAGLRAFARGSRVRVSRLYAPAAPAPSQATDPGP